MKMDMLRKMKMPGGKDAAPAKGGLMLEVGMGKPKGDDEDGDAEQDAALAKFSEMDLLEELKDRGCVDDDQFAAIQDHIKSKSDEGSQASDEDQSSEEDHQGPAY